VVKISVIHDSSESYQAQKLAVVIWCLNTCNLSFFVNVCSQMPISVNYQLAQGQGAILLWAGAEGPFRHSTLCGTLR